MLSVLMTSTMKSDPSGPWDFASSLGVPVSAAATWALGRTADGRRAGASAVSATGAVAATAASCGDTAVAAPATATPAMKLRRLTLRTRFLLSTALACHHFLLGRRARSCAALASNSSRRRARSTPPEVKLACPPAMSSGFRAFPMRRQGRSLALNATTGVGRAPAVNGSRGCGAKRRNCRHRP